MLHDYSGREGFTGIKKKMIDAAIKSEEEAMSRQNAGAQQQETQQTQEGEASVKKVTTSRTGATETTTTAAAAKAHTSTTEVCDREQGESSPLSTVPALPSSS